MVKTVAAESTARVPVHTAPPKARQPSPKTRSIKCWYAGRGKLLMRTAAAPASTTGKVRVSAFRMTEKNSMFASRSQNSDENGFTLTFPV